MDRSADLRSLMKRQALSKICSTGDMPQTKLTGKEKLLLLRQQQQQTHSKVPKHVTMGGATSNMSQQQQTKPTKASLPSDFFDNSEDSMGNNSSNQRTTMTISSSNNSKSNNNVTESSPNRRHLSSICNEVDHQSVALRAQSITVPLDSVPMISGVTLAAYQSRVANKSLINSCQRKRRLILLARN